MYKIPFALSLLILLNLNSIIAQNKVAYRIYDNKGPIGGGWIFDLHTEYTLNGRIRLKLQLNNILDQDGPRVVGTPPMRRNMIFETLFNF